MINNSYRQMIIYITTSYIVMVYVATNFTLNITIFMCYLNTAKIILHWNCFVLYRTAQAKTNSGL